MPLIDAIKIYDNAYMNLLNTKTMKSLGERYTYTVSEHFSDFLEGVHITCKKHVMSFYLSM